MNRFIQRPPMPIPQTPQPTRSNPLTASVGIPARGKSPADRLARMPDNIAQSPPIDIPEIKPGEELVDLDYIVEEKPRPKVVREFFKKNLGCIQDDD